MPEDRSNRRNYALLLAQGVSNSSGYQLTSDKLVLPFLYSTLGAPIFFAGLLAPIVTVAKLFIQIFAAPLISAARTSKWFIAFSSGAWALALAVLALAVYAAPVGLVIPVFVLVALVLGAARGLNSLAFQSLVGRILAHQQRSRLLFTVSSIAGLFAVAVALASQFVLAPGTPLAAHEELLWLGIGLILLSAVLIALVHETPKEPSNAADIDNDLSRPIVELRRSFRIAFALPWLPRFLVARTLFLSIELSTPFFAVHAASFHASNVNGLSSFVIASSLGMVIGGFLWPRISKDSVLFILVLAASVACLGGLLAIAIELRIVPQSIYLYSLVFVLVGLGSQGIRSGRVLYLMSVTDDNDRPVCIAVANVTIGVVAVGFGAVLGGLASFKGVAWPIVALIIMNIAAAVFALKLRDIRPQAAA